MKIIRAEIAPVFSIYLDAIRFLAALSVVLHHTWELVFPKFPLPWPGHTAVVVFFVISGYVIAHAAAHPNASLRLYAGNRLARVLSVSIPAILLGLFIAPMAGTSMINNAGPMDLSILDMVANSVFSLFFLGQSWGFDFNPPYNPPFWSLCFEVWYYVIFAAWTYSSKRFRLLATVITMLLAGPKILLLMPVWLLGVAIYRWAPKMPQSYALALFMLSSVIGLLFFWFDISVTIRTAMAAQWPTFMRSIHGANQFVGDFFMGLVVSANFIAAANLTTMFKAVIKVEKPIRYLASFTFSTYLYHMPLAVLLWNGLAIHSAAQFYGLLFIGIFVLAQATERRVTYFRALMLRSVFVRTRRQSIYSKAN